MIAPTLRVATPDAVPPARAYGVSVEVSVPPTNQSVAMRTPGGLLLLLPAVLLVAAFPLRPYWIYLWVYHMLIGGVMLLLLCAGLQGAGWGVEAYRFVSGHLYMGTSLAAPLLALWVERSRPSQTDA